MTPLTSHLIRCGSLPLLAIAWSLAVPPSCGQIPPATQPPQPTEADELVLDQSQLADRYQRMEQLILRMAEFDQAENPRRAMLLKNAFALAKDRDIGLHLEAATRMLQRQKLQRAIDGQQQARRDLQALLDLLLTENRADRLKDEQARFRDYIREIERLERMQRSVQARTEGGVDATQLRREQNQVADGAQQLQQTIGDTELADNSSETGEPQPATAPHSKSSPAQPGSQQPDADRRDADSTPAPGSQEGEPTPTPADAPPVTPRPPSADREARDNPLRLKSDADRASPSNKLRAENRDSNQPPRDESPAPSDGGSGAKRPSPAAAPGQPSPDGSSKPSNPSQPQSGSPSPQGGDAGEDTGEPPVQQPQPPEFPGLRRVQEAEQKMRDAERKLAEAKRDGALDDQREAARKLAEAKAELEKILRQMREEEIERVLASLEVRFRKMLEMQLRVRDDTVRLARAAETDRNRLTEMESSQLSLQERRIVVEADKCLVLLREEGSSAAFPESAQQMRDDMQQVTDLLATANVGSLTQGIEQDIIEALEEMIEALDQAQSDQEQRKQNPAAMPAVTPGDLPLVDALAELTMLKALQLRINRRTNRFAAMLDNTDDPVGKPTDEKLLQAVRELADRQQRLQEITRDISIGKNN